MKKARLVNDRIWIKFTGKGTSFNKVLKAIQSLEEDKRFVITSGEWDVEYTDNVVETLRKLNFDIPSDLYLKWKSNAIDEKWRDLKIPSKYDFLFPYQKDALRFSRYHYNRVLQALDMGLGKSIIALINLDMVSNYPTIIICPSIVKEGFQREYNKFIHGDTRIKIIESSSEMLNYGNSFDILIINYELIARNMNKKKKGNTEVFYPNDILKKFKTNQFSMAVIDEVHKMKNIDSQTTRGVQFLLDSTDSIIGLTGTPIESSSKDIFPFLNLIRPDLFPSYYSFVNRYCESEPDGRGGRRYFGSRNSAELNAILISNCMFRLTKEEAKVDRDKPIITISPIKMKHPSDYHSLAQNVKGEDSFIAVKKLKDEAWEQKKDGVIEFIDEMLDSSSDKITIFAHNKVVIDFLMEKYRDIALKIDGGVSTKTGVRSGIIEKFGLDKKIRLLICSIESIGTGTDGIQQYSSVGVFVQFPWNYSTFDQTCSRLDRTGQTKLVNIHLLPAEDSIDIDILGIIDRKNRVSTKIVDGKELNESETLKELLRLTNRRLKE